ncbi:MAG: hypothetical protein PS018_14765 [bacterium]|nr:hypothetical protein [bacterium]
MAGVPAHCDNCGIVFNSSAFEVGPAALEVTISGIDVICPNCGSDAHLIDGTFDFVGNAIKVLAAPPRTIEILKALQAALRAAEAGEPEEKVLAHIEKESPELAKAAKTAAKGGRHLLVGALLLLAAQCSVNVTSTLDVNELVDQVHVYVTGSSPYPTKVPPSQASPPGRKAGPNREQRRQQEHQSRRQKQPSEQKSPQKPEKK